MSEIRVVCVEHWARGTQSADAVLTCPLPGHDCHATVMAEPVVFDAELATQFELYWGQALDVR